jgi:hypothetical protein
MTFRRFFEMNFSGFDEPEYFSGAKAAGVCNFYQTQPLNLLLTFAAPSRVNGSLDLTNYPKFSGLGFNSCSLRSFHNFSSQKISCFQQGIVLFFCHSESPVEVVKKL